MLFYITYLLCMLAIGYCEDYYKLLGISKDADNLEIRKAFKKLALKFHPDKIRGGEDSHDKFIEINKAYEVLKDEEMRKKYDLYGEDGLENKHWGTNYHSWSYYSESFGIYDDDPEIMTLNRQDFAQRVSGSSDFWFVNFYSPSCSHCHHLAPAWRELAKELYEVIQIGAVNCEEDWMLCRNQNIQSYPSLMLYPHRQKYKGSRDAESMIEFVLQQLPDKVIALKSYALTEQLLHQKYPLNRWLIFSCEDKKGCFDHNDLTKLGIILDNLINVAVIESSDSRICEKLHCDYKVALYENFNAKGPNDNFVDLSSAGLDFRALVKMIFELLPSPDEISNKILEDIISSNKSKGQKSSYLIYFTKLQSKTDSIDMELKRIKSLLPEISLGYFDCEKHPNICSSLYIQKYPTFILFKSRGSYEFYHGKITVHDIVRFSKDTVMSKVQTLTPETFPAVIQSGENWFIDFFAPWCPPCMELLPEWRKISQHFGDNVKFGTIDCTAHLSLCRQNNINSYPTTILFNQSVPHRYNGFHSHNQMKEFVEDIIQPSVVSLTPSLFENLVNSKNSSEIWVVDYFAPWCGACQQLSPHWRKLAKMLKDVSSVHVGEVNCQIYNSICDDMNIHSFPTIHLYPFNSIGTEKFSIYNGRSRDSVYLRAWVYDFLPTKVEALTGSAFKNILSDSRPWIVDFFAPWCSSCQLFAPDFHKVAQIFDSKIKFGKVNCDIYADICRIAGVRAYPTVMFYHGSEKHSTQNPAGREIKTLNFDGVHSFLTAWLEQNKTQRPPKTEL